MKSACLRFAGVLTLVFLLGTPPVGAASQQGSAVTSERLADFEAELETLRTVLQIPGMAVGIVEAGELVWAKGFGFANVEQGIPVTPATPFRIASVTKTFTATLAMQLLEEGALDLDEPISNYGVSVGDPQVTVRHLLSHTSEGTPGSAFRYDGDRYANLTTVIEQAGGARFSDLLQERIFSPAGMTSTGPSRPGQASTDYGELWAGLASPYRWDVADGVVPGVYPAHFSAAAGLISTIEDLARYDAALDTGSLVSSAARAAMFAPNVTPGGEVLPYGLGWFTQEFRSTRLVWHFGGTDVRNPAGRHGWESISALLLKVPDRDLTLIALANVDMLNRMYRLVEGDILRQALAIEFYGRFVADGVPVIDWTADEGALGSQLEGPIDSTVREVLERELAAYQLTYLGLGDAEGVRRLSNVLREAFDWPPLIPVSPQASSSARAWSWLVFWMLAGWSVLVAGSVWVVRRRLRRNRSAWPSCVLWQGAALLLGPVAVWAHRVESHQGNMSRALSACAVAVLAPAAGTAVAVTLAGEFDLRAVVVGFLLGLVLIRAPLRARSGRRYGSALWKSIPWELMSTLSVFAGFLMAVPLLDGYASSFGLRPEPGSLVFWGISSSASLVGMLTTFPVQYWMARRGRVAMPGVQIVETEKSRKFEIAAMATGAMGLLAVGLFVVGAL